MGRLYAYALTFLCIMQLAHTAHAIDPENVNFAGFASFGYAKAIDEATETNLYTAKAFGPDNAKVSGLQGMTEEGEYRDYNKFGFRLDVNLDNKLSFAAQMFVDGTTDYDPQFDWIYVNYAITPSVNISVGRMILPLYMYSDYFDVGYAYQWIRPPDAVYGGGNNVKTGDGIRLTWRSDIGSSWSSLLTVWSAASEQEVLSTGAPIELSTDNAIGASWEIERRWLTIKMLYSQTYLNADMPIGLNMLIDQRLTNIGVSSGYDVRNPSTYFDQQFAEQLEWKDDKATFTSLGIGLDFEHFFSTAEFTNAKFADDADNYAGNHLRSWYVMVGTRLPGNWSIAFTYSEDNDDLNSGMAQELGDAFIDKWGTGTNDAALRDVTNFLKESQQRDTENYTLSTRWDFHPKAAFKMEYLYSRLLLGNTPERTPSAFRVAIDLVF